MAVRPLVVVTPEGVPLSFAVAGADARLSAALFDLLILFGVSLAVGLAASLAQGSGVALAIGFVALFVLRNFYFTFFEIRWRGQTPGKRRLGLRVVDARGGPLTAEAVFARNLTRELELFLPIGVLFGAEVTSPSAPGLVRVVASLWVLVCMFLPLFSREHVRVGDLVGGTRVVVEPAARLLSDVAHAKAHRFVFVGAALEHYGIKELRVLEDLLRLDHPSTEALAIVASRVARRVGMSEPDAADHEVFLRDFYAQQRAHLEQRMVLGDRREDKVAARSRR